MDIQPDRNQHQATQYPGQRQDKQAVAVASGSQQL
jgi:hypothetical protein